MDEGAARLPSIWSLTAQALKKHFGSEVTFVNNAVDGTTSSDGLQQANDGQVSKHSPDLVIIAYGMNDAYHRRSVADYKMNIRRMMERIRSDAPNAEFILVASMLPNVERGTPLDRFYHYRNVLAELRGPGAALADLMSIWADLLKRKSFYDLTRKGVNHPNDFGHCIYAQTLLATLIHSPEKSVRGLASTYFNCDPNMSRTGPISGHSSKEGPCRIMT